MGFCLFDFSMWARWVALTQRNGVSCCRCSSPGLVSLMTWADSKVQEWGNIHNLEHSSGKTTPAKHLYAFISFILNLRFERWRKEGMNEQQPCFCPRKIGPNLDHLTSFDSCLLLQSRMGRLQGCQDAKPVAFGSHLATLWRNESLSLGWAESKLLPFLFNTNRIKANSFDSYVYDRLLASPEGLILKPNLEKRLLTDLFVYDKSSLALKSPLASAVVVSFSYCHLQNRFRHTYYQWPTVKSLGFSHSYPIQSHIFLGHNESNG